MLSWIEALLRRWSRSLDWRMAVWDHRLRHDEENPFAPDLELADIDFALGLWLEEGMIFASPEVDEAFGWESVPPDMYRCVMIREHGDGYQVLGEWIPPKLTTRCTASWPGDELVGDMA